MHERLGDEMRGRYMQREWEPGAVVRVVAPTVNEADSQ